MSEADHITVNVIFPIGQQLYDAVIEQVRSTGASLDQLYGDACAGSFACLPGLERQNNRGLHSFHIEELGNRESIETFANRDAAENDISLDQLFDHVCR